MDRFCENCRAEIPRGADSCPQCGTFAGDIFDGKLPVRRRLSKWIVIVIVVGMAAIAWMLLQRRATPTQLTTPTTRVVSDRPGGSRKAAGASINEAEAIRILRRHLVESGVKNECVAISSQDPAAGVYRLTAVNSCTQTRLGRFKVDGNGEIKR